MTEEKSDLNIRISIGCASRVPGPVTTTTTVLATIDMPEFRGVNMSGIDEFDSIVSDRIVDEIGFKDDIKDLGNLGIIDREKPRDRLCQIRRKISRRNCPTSFPGRIRLSDGCPR